MLCKPIESHLSNIVVLDGEVKKNAFPFSTISYVSRLNYGSIRRISKFTDNRDNLPIFWVKVQQAQHWQRTKSYPQHHNRLEVGYPS